MNASLKPTQKETLEVALEKRTANVRIPRTDSEGLYPDAVGRPRGIAFQSLGMGSFTAEAIHKTILQLLKNEPRGTLLDIGAGTGALSKKLQEDGFNVLACDLNPENFIPKRDVPCKRVDLNDALPYEDGTFDVVVGAEVVEHVENPWHLVRELQRITKPNGIVVLSTPNLHNWYARLYFFATARLYNFLSSYEKIGHITPVFVWNLERMARGRFQFTEIRTTHSLIPGLGISIPFKGLFWGQCVVVKMKREESMAVGGRRAWYR